MALVKAGLAAALVIAGAWLAGLFAFVAALPGEDTWHHRAPPPGSAIVVLTGGSERLTAGVDLLAEDGQRVLFISGVNRAVDAATLAHQLGPAAEAALAEGRLEIGHAARNTPGNAAEVAAWASRRGIDGLILVTAAYHMPRSLFELRRALPGVRIVPHPVFPASVRQGDWWRWPGTSLLLAGEYTKYLLTRGRHLLGLTAPPIANP
ncbi:YdcF family protein [Roseospirillum parvum]|uniref:YdcF family protein n=1 Tax=Roseospirillum parvum TaxID=83401 RepID=UPI001FE02D3B|nr:YdcF family protein [Roseospirillum parvum]